ncbi:hypothetical protein L1987_28415 [Smallanthus sonchifolius]|uniref:Uncharacterized protein n=1 Tax=Smallanthus sonchifolius TaxID=185202 RepID=A0ACB9HYC7_9ASTR|nr:hypothetical protein L1987_28415 [Smallanthus sonchifolius]
MRYREQRRRRWSHLSFVVFADGNTVFTLSKRLNCIFNLLVHCENEFCCSHILLTCTFYYFYRILNEDWCVLPFHKGNV